MVVIHKIVGINMIKSVNLNFLQYFVHKRLIGRIFNCSSLFSFPGFTLDQFCSFPLSWENSTS